MVFCHALFETNFYNSMNRIKDVINEKGYTIKSLAEELGITRESLSRSLVSPSYPTLQRIAEALGVELWELFIAPKDVPAEELRCPHCGKPIKINIQ